MSADLWGDITGFIGSGLAGINGAISDSVSGIESVAPVALNTAVVATTGVVAAPAYLWDIGWNIGSMGEALVTGKSLDSIEESTLGTTVQNSILGDVSNLTGYTANTSLVSDTVKSYEKSNDITGWAATGLNIFGLIADLSISNPVVNVGQLVPGLGILGIAQILPEVPSLATAVANLA
jgi:hypothetical protein